MKAFILASLTIIVLVASVVRADLAPVPSELNDKIRTAIAEKCEWVPLPSLRLIANDVRMVHAETETNVEYETTYTGDFYFDRAHPLSVYITVRSTQLDVESERRYEVISVESSDPWACNPDFLN